MGKQHENIDATHENHEKTMNTNGMNIIEETMNII